ncbi:MAG TPA: DUF423 domain-containing protein [Caulobacterales bacterium]|nr:DUF423 domain-containing protein [Caulobacterales bacterium]
MNNFRLYAVLAALFGLAAVAIGAFGAHGLSDERARHLIDVGAHYHVTHTLAAIGALAFWRWGATRARFAAAFFFGGIWLFSGSLYALALGAPAIVGAITPIGGVLFMIGWALLAWAGLQLPRDKGASS